MSLERKICKNWCICLQSALEPATKYGVLVVPNAMRLKKYADGDSAMMILDSTGGRIHLPLSIREITQFKTGDTVRYYKRGDIIIIYSYDYTGDGTEFNDIKV